MLKELPNTVVHCKTREEYDRLMRIYEANGWTHWTGHRATDGRNCGDGPGYYPEAKDSFWHMSATASGKMISLPEFLREQGLDTLTPSDLKPGDYVEVVEYFAEHDIQFCKGSRYKVVEYAGREFSRCTYALALDVRYSKTCPHTLVKVGNVSKLRKIPAPEVPKKDCPDCEKYKAEAEFARAETKMLQEYNRVQAENEDRYRRHLALSGHYSEPKKPFWKRMRAGEKVIVTSTPNRSTWFEEMWSPTDRKEASAFRVIEYFDTTPHRWISTGDLVSIPTPIPPSRMSVSDYFRNTALSAEERTLRKAGIKDSCGKLTCDGKELLLTFLADKYKSELAKEAKKYLQALKDEDDEDSE